MCRGIKAHANWALVAGITCKSFEDRANGADKQREEGTKLTAYHFFRSCNRPMKSNPFNFWGKVIDCGDIPVTS
jgi:hypothetical protein